MIKSTVMQMKNNYAAFYLRLSKEDNKFGESASIENQRKILLQYLSETDFLLYNEYVDDGFSGTSMNRPALNRMLDDIEKGKIGIVLTKDFSRLGRNSGRVQILLDEFFTKNRVRYIAVSDGIDTMQQNSATSMITPVLGFANELYAGDISRKINASFGAKMMHGDFIGAFAPYGYQKDPKNKNRLLEDPVSSEIIKKIFGLAKDGYSSSQIAVWLNRENILTPSLYRLKTNPQLDEQSLRIQRAWSAGTISKILRNEVYLGKMLQGKTHKASFKSDYIYLVPKENWICVENTHSPLVDRETWEIVRKKMRSRTQVRTKGFVNIFSGIAKCADCGKNMSTVGSRKKGVSANLSCGGYKLGGLEKCTNHFIAYDRLYEIVLNSLNSRISFTEAEKTELLDRMLEVSRESISSQTEDVLAKLDTVKKKIKKLFEDKYNGIIEGDLFESLLLSFGQEKSELEKRAREQRRQESSVEDEVRRQEKVETFKTFILEYEHLSALDSELLFKLIDRIDVHQGTFENGIKRQQIDIYFKFYCEPQVLEV